MTIEIDLNEFTLGEVEELENAVGRSLAELFEGSNTGLAYAWCIYIQNRRSDPSYTLEQAKSVKWPDVSFKKAEDKAVDPTAGNGSASSSSSLISSAGH